MALDREDIIQEQEELKLLNIQLNQQLLSQVAALQNDSTETEGNP